jgi:hypothetical protein
MRSTYRTGALVIAAMAGALFNAPPAAAVDPLNPHAPCSVFDAAPCTPSHCGVFGPWPCVPVFPPHDQGTRFTIKDPNLRGGRAPEGPVNSIREMVDALRECWEWPRLPAAISEMQMTVRFSFKRSGELLGPPRVTYTSPEADPASRRIYRQAIDDMFARCTPMPFSQSMAGAIIGRPISVRFIGNRIEQE